MPDSNNPFMASGIGMQEGYNTGAQWATQSAHLQLQKQQIQNQQEQTQLMKNEFQSKIGKQMFNDITSLAQMPNGPTKDSLIKSRQDYYEQIGQPIHDSQWASTKDPNFQIDYAALKSSVDGAEVADPEAVNKTYRNFAGVLSNEAAINLIQTSAKGYQMLAKQALQNKANLEIANIKTEGMKEATQNRIENTNLRAGQKEYDQKIKPIQDALENAARPLDLIKYIEDPNVPDDKKIAATKQIVSILSNDEAKLVTGKSNFGEGTAANLAVDTYAARAKALKAKIQDSPEGVISSENLQQMKNFYNELTNTYMEGSDRIAESLKGGSTPAQLKVIEGKQKAFQDTYRKKFGRWPGEDAGKNSPESGLAPVPDKFTPNQLKSAQALKDKLSRMPEGPEKARALSKIQTTLSPELRKTIGLQ